MIGEAEAYAAADQALEAYLTFDFGTAAKFDRVRDVLALTYMIGLLDGLKEGEEVATSVMDDLRKALA